jgi:DNA-binding MarR family transcriptional regulator
MANETPFMQSREAALGAAPPQSRENCRRNWFYELHFAPRVSDGTLAVARVLEAAERTYAALCSRLEQFGLNDVRFAALSGIESAAPEGCTQCRLAELLGQSESSVSTLVGRMRADGLLYRLRSKSDRRKHLLALTPAGRELLQQARAAQAAGDLELLPGLDAAQTRLLSELLGTLVSALAQPPSPASADADRGIAQPTAA